MNATNPTTAPQRILVIQTAFIGDAILATALLESLHKRFPEASIDLLVRQGNESLFVHHPFLQRVIVWQKKEGKNKQLFKIIRQVRKQRYNVIVNPHRFASSGLICALSGAKTTLGFDKNPLSFTYSKTFTHGYEGLHEVERNHQLIREITGTEVPERPRLYPSETDETVVRELKAKPFRCLAPTSVWFTKQWPAEKWVELINALPQEENIYLLGAPSDQKACESIASKAHHPKVQTLAGKLKLLASAALMKDAAMNYVNDSAPMHLASSVNAPVTAIYCSTIPQFGFGPLSDVSQVVETLEPLDCRSCGIHGHRACPKGHFKCAHLISISQFEGLR